MTPQTTPVSLDLKRDEKLEIQWQDGHRSTYPVGYLRAHCPCALCRTMREEQSRRKSLLTVLPGDGGPVVVREAELVGNYALRIEWSDNHSTGIYSFQYLREISPD